MRVVYRSGLVSVSVVNTMTKNDLGKKRIYLAYTTRSQSIPKASQKRIPDRHHGRTLVTDKHRLTLRFFIQPRLTCLGIVPPTVDWALPCQSSAKTISHRLEYRSIFLDYSSTEAPSFQATLQLCQVHSKN